MVAGKPFTSSAQLCDLNEKVWNALAQKDWLEAFTHHPEIGDVDSLKKKFASTAHWAGDEQQGAAQASEDVLVALKQGNEEYKRKFGFIFIVCATGKTAQQMLDLLQQRLPNEADQEIVIAAAEQCKITDIRLNKLMSAQS